MYKGTNPNPNGIYEFEEQQYPTVGYMVNKPGNAGVYADSPISAAKKAMIYGSDEFRMYAYKIKRCPRTRSHDWTEGPYAHHGEKATRRDPRRHGYCAVSCPAYRHGVCHRGDTCDFAHGVFEYWLHPARYRTRACNSGKFCQRKVCFFAHSPDQLRQPAGPAAARCRFVSRPVPAAAAASSSRGGAVATVGPAGGGTTWNAGGVNHGEMVMTELWKSFHGMSIMDDSSEMSDFDLSHVDWISELVDGSLGS
ncbi:PREDICTED: LOW QUALITY PROTEIN: zinc finger CCCH domain-containing protein 54 [Tarenaya hassleriana]|uniref:LOW QUALITY PROTEIN: zinc finger CCCH domain-containing protein 54 n=1 Tax=Tarenaya hassleriana TaxID=28532 RepID=UPI00053C816B|nr:PREDICTED: LOW QUALITY PROTEIN: zinc finger CCCH domain-containing protein 54 [Tarenaya hassleriana]